MVRFFLPNRPRLGLQEKIQKNSVTFHNVQSDFEKGVNFAGQIQECISSVSIKNLSTSFWFNCF